MEFDHTAQVRALSSLPPEPPKPRDWSVWSTLWNATRAGVSETIATVGKVTKAYGAAQAIADEGNPLAMAALGSDAVRRGADEGREVIARGDYETQVGRSFRNVADELLPDPMTASTAETTVFELGRGLTKAIGSTLALGPVGGAGLFGASEADRTFEDLRAQGVDAATALKAAGVTGAVSAASVVLPLSGPTLKATAGLYLAGGPGGFVAQQAATRAILERADYGKIAAQYDPLDPLGLTLAALVPLPFAAAGALRNVRAGRTAAPGAESGLPAAERQEVGAEVPRDAVDAAMAHNLTLQADDVASRRPTLDSPDIQRLPAERREQMVAMYDAAAASKPAFDSAISDIAAAVGGNAKLVGLKQSGRAVDKVLEDYGGDPTRIRDLLRATVEVDSSAAAQRAVASMFERFEVLPTGRRNLLDPAVEPVDGYRDAKLNVRLPDGTVAEVQVNLPSMLAAKKTAHPLYVERETIKRNAEGRLRTPQEQARIDDLNARMRAIYDPAWNSAMRARNAASSMGPPLRVAESDENLRGGRVSQAAQENGQPGTLPIDTGMPSTSSSSARPNDAGSSSAGEAGFMSTSDSIIGGNPIGRGAEVVTEQGLRVPVRYRLVEAGDLITSHGDDLAPNAAFPAELQPRDRTRAASAEQVARIENALRPELLGESVKASDGAPIVGPDGVVESGNARTIALRRAYGSGKADGYGTWLSSNAERFGLQADDVQAMRQPVLVRERLGEIDRAEFARQANESPVAALSPVEQARADASRMTDLSGLVANEDGTINMARSQDFVRGFMRGVSPNERGALMQADGRLSQAGQQRIRNAVFAKAYGDPSILAALSESTNSNVRNVLAGLLRAAPEVARLQDLIAAGARQPIDLAPDLVRAVRELDTIRQEGRSLDDVLAQGDLLGGGMPPAVRTMLVGLAENARAPRRIAEMVQRMVQAVDALGDPRQASMLDDPGVRPEGVAADAVERMRALSDDQLAGVDPEPAAPKVDAMVRMVDDRVRAIELNRPELRVDDNTTAAEFLAKARREAAEGTDAELGALDADLVRVAAECALSAG